MKCNDGAWSLEYFIDSVPDSIKCSICGKTRYEHEMCALELYHDGWRSYYRKCYCPDCARIKGLLKEATN